jgi:hypothetical protein
LINKNDSVLAFSSRSNGQGNFLIEKIKAGDYTVLVTFPGMADFILDVNLKDTGAVDIGKIVMTSRFHLVAGSDRTKRKSHPHERRYA